MIRRVRPAANTSARIDRDPALTNFDLFVQGLSVLSLLNILLLIMPLDEEEKRAIWFLDTTFSFVLLVDFFRRLHRAQAKSAYLIGDWGWLDLLGSLPFPPFRLARLYRMTRVAQRLQRDGWRGFWQKLFADRADGALYAAVFLTTVVLEFGSIAILWREKGASNANIRTASDALWWSFVTIATVGYGDRYPVTNEGRLIGVVVMSVGVALFGVITGYLANVFLKPKRAAARAANRHRRIATRRQAIRRRPPRSRRETPTREP